MKKSTGLLGIAALLVAACGDHQMGAGDGGKTGGTGGSGGSDAGSMSGGGNPGAKVTLGEVTSGGAGCGAPATAAMDEHGALVVTLTGLSLSHPPSGTFDHTNCAATVTLHVPTGYRVRVTQGDFAGMAQLPAGASASATSSVFFAGDASTLELRVDLMGPREGAYTLSNMASGAMLSACGGDVLLTDNVGLSLDTSGNAGADASIDVRTSTLMLTLEPC